MPEPQHTCFQATDEFITSEIAQSLLGPLVPGFGEFGVRTELHGSVVLHASADVKPVSWLWPGAQAGTLLAWAAR